MCWEWMGVDRRGWVWVVCWEWMDVDWCGWVWVWIGVATDSVCG